VERQLTQQYLGTGKVSFTYKQMPVLGNDSVMAAEAAECAADQNQFGQYQDKLFQAQKQPGGYSQPNLLKYASQIGLDQQKFTACVTGRQTAAKVLADREEGRKLGITGTPATSINGRMVDGLAPVAVFQKIIDEELAK
jgi:protein-disulfide isomerase